MKNLIQSILCLIAAVAVGISSTGCASLGFVEAAEKTLQSASITMDTYIAFADRHRDTLGDDALAVAEEIRTSGPRYVSDAFEALQNYKAVRSDANKGDFIAARDTLLDLLQRAAAHLTPTPKPTLP